MKIRKHKWLAVIATVFLIVGYFGSIACLAQNDHPCCSPEPEKTCEIGKGNYSDAAPKVQLDNPAQQAASVQLPVKVKAASSKLFKKLNNSVKAPKENLRLKTHHLTNAPPLS